MARYQVKIVYDGTEFFGMQRQLEERTVQGEIENSLRKIGWNDQSILFAGRTDAGVHANGQVVAFDLTWKHGEEKLKKAINSVLPQDIAAKAIRETEDNFHPRYDALSRSYVYQIYCKPDRDPISDKFNLRIWPEIELDTLNKAASKLIGQHDFSAFGTPPKENGSTIREVFSASWEKDRYRYFFTVKANAFLYHMVRRMVNVQIEIAHGRKTVEFISDALDGKIVGVIQGIAPAHGLFLEEVEYADKEIN
jgi:tRNA pseudouridine38-40 synthase